MTSMQTFYSFLFDGDKQWTIKARTVEFDTTIGDIYKGTLYVICGLCV
jgi:hypothetical protein